MRFDRLLTTPSSSFPAAKPRLKNRRCVGAKGRLRLTAPEDWSLEATSAFTDALYDNAPQECAALEENTVPSWLWAHRAGETGRGIETCAEQVFNRVIGSATFKGWRLGLWSDETTASAFRDEMAALMSHRLIALAFPMMHTLGVTWAYGDLPSARTNESDAASLQEPSPVPLGNATIDGVLATEPSSERVFWNQLIHQSTTHGALATQFSDTVKEWGTVQLSETTPRGALNLPLFVKENGELDVFLLQQAVRSLALLLELHHDEWSGEASKTRAIAIGMENLAGLLLRMGLAYDSKEGRSTAAAIAAIITAESVATSAEMARALGAAPAFITHRETALRCLRNMRRAAHDEETDYERLSILPHTLAVESGAHLVLISTARYAWDEAYEKAQRWGLRNFGLTGTNPDATLSTFLESAAPGIGPLKALVLDRAVDEDEDDTVFRREIVACARQALHALPLAPEDRAAITAHALGARTLKGAPGLSQTALAAKGFDKDVLSKIEDALTSATSLRAVFTPWTLGFDFCVNTLGIDETEVDDLAFDLLEHLGFDTDAVTCAERFCFGTGEIAESVEIGDDIKPLFATEATLPPSARIAMAAAIQSFSGYDLAPMVTLDAETPHESREEILLQAWRSGLRSVALLLTAKPEPEKRSRKILAAKKPPSLPIPPASVAGDLSHITSPTKPRPASRQPRASRAHVAPHNKTSVEKGRKA